MTTLLSDGRVEFRFFRRNVTNVCVAGTFNKWEVLAAPMRRDPEGWWQTRLQLPDGVHQFRYFADGEWYTDFAAHGVEHSKWGLNSLLVIGPVRAIAA